jgi:hypothetical protein
MEVGVGGRRYIAAREVGEIGRPGALYGRRARDVLPTVIVTLVIAGRGATAGAVVVVGGRPALPFLVLAFALLLLDILSNLLITLVVIVVVPGMASADLLGGGGGTSTRRGGVGLGRGASLGAHGVELLAEHHAGALSRLLLAFPELLLDLGLHLLLLLSVAHLQQIEAVRTPRLVQEVLIFVIAPARPHPFWQHQQQQHATSIEAVVEEVVSARTPPPLRPT